MHGTEKYLYINGKFKLNIKISVSSSKKRELPKGGVILKYVKLILPFLSQSYDTFVPPC